MDKQTIEKLKSELAEAETPEKVKEVCEKYGVDKLSEEEVNAALMCSIEHGELDDDDLDKVSGGARDLHGHLLVGSGYSCEYFVNENSPAPDVSDWEAEAFKNHGITRGHCHNCRHSKWAGIPFLYACHR